MPDRVALVEGRARRRRSAVDVRRAAGRGRAVSPRSLLARFEPGERVGRVGAQPARVGAARVRRRPRRHHAGHRQPELPAGRGRLRARPVPGRRRVRRPGGAGQPARRPRRGDPRRPARPAPRPAARRASAELGGAQPVDGPQAVRSRRRCRTTRRRSSTRAARPASRRGRCCATAASSTTPCSGRTGSGSPTGRCGCRPMPLFHTGGCVMGVLGALDRRATLVLMPMFDPALFLELIERERAWFAAAVPTMLIAVMDHPDADRPRPLVVAVDGVGRRPGARGARAAHRGHARRRLHDRLRPDRVLAGR